jgi:hypothetical protein
MAGPQRGTAARGKRQGNIERTLREYEETTGSPRSKYFRKIIDENIDTDTAPSSLRGPAPRTMGPKDEEEYLRVGAALEDASDGVVDAKYSRIRRNKEALDRSMRGAAKRFGRSSESDSPGYKKGGMPDLTGDGKVTRADVLKGRGVFKHGGNVKKYASGGSVSSASKRADGCAVKGKTKGRFV